MFTFIALLPLTVVAVPMPTQPKVPSGVPSPSTPKKKAKRVCSFGYNNTLTVGREATEDRCGFKIDTRFGPIIRVSQPTLQTIEACVTNGFEIGVATSNRPHEKTDWPKLILHAGVKLLSG